MQTFLTILLHELLLSSRNLGKILANFLFFLISVAIFFLISQNQEVQGSTTFYSVTIIWFSLLFCLIFSAAEFLKKDFDDGTIEQVLTSCENFEIFILAKMLGNWLVCCLPILISIFPLGIGLGFEKDFVINFLILIFLASLAINFICSLCGSLSTLGNSAPMIGVIVLPLIIPVLLIAFGGMAGDFWTSFKILAGLCVFVSATSIFATAKIVRIAVE